MVRQCGDVALHQVVHLAVLAAHQALLDQLELAPRVLPPLWTNANQLFPQSELDEDALDLDAVERLKVGGSRMHPINNDGFLFRVTPTATDRERRARLVFACQKRLRLPVFVEFSHLIDVDPCWHCTPPSSSKHPSSYGRDCAAALQDPHEVSSRAHRSDFEKLVLCSCIGQGCFHVKWIEDS